MTPSIKSTTTGAHPVTEELRAASTHRSYTGIRIASVVLVALGVAILVGTTQIPSARDGWDIAGPRFLPLVVGIALTALALLFAARTVVRPDTDLADYVTAENERTTWPTPALMLGTLVVYALLMPRLGYALATTLFVVAGARILGSRDPVRDAVVGLGIGVLTGLLFGALLGVPLPVGRFGV